MVGCCLLQITSLKVSFDICFRKTLQMFVVWDWRLRKLADLRFNADFVADSSFRRLYYPSWCPGVTELCRCVLFLFFYACLDLARWQDGCWDTRIPGCQIKYNDLGDWIKAWLFMSEIRRNFFIDGVVVLWNFTSQKLQILSSNIQCRDWSRPQR